MPETDSATADGRPRLEIDRYFEALAPIYGEIAALDDEGLAARLPHGTAQSGFARLT